MKILSITARTISIELENNEPYFSENKFSIYLNKEFLREEEKNVFTIFDLEPTTVYEIEVEKEKLIVSTKNESVCLDVKRFHAKGDGIHDDTVMFQAAISCCPPNGTVYVPSGIYLVSTIFLKSDMMLYLEKDAKIIAKYERTDFPILPGTIGQFHFGTWEGSEVDNFASTITAIHAHNLVIAGQGEIDEQAQLGDWYHNHREKRIAWRGFGMYLYHCADVEVVGIYIHNSPSWNVHPYFSKELKFINMRIENEPSMPTTDGLDPDCCEDVQILGCYFSVGDDCIALKSGTFDLAKKYQQACKNITIRNNYMCKGHGGVVFGSESSGGIENVTVSQCIFEHTDRGLRIKTRRGRGNVGIIDNVCFENIKMNYVLTPFVINMFYNMGPAGGHDEYVWTTKKLPVDEYTPMIGHFKFSNMICENVGYAAGVFLGLPESKIAGIEFENVHFSYDSTQEEGYPVMIEHNFKLKNAGLYCFNVEKIITKNVTFQGTATKEIIEVEDIK